MNFQEKVRSMTAAEIIRAMVESLIPPPAIRIDMGTYGEARNVNITKGFSILGLQIIKPKKEVVCFGCAATNTVCKISGSVFTKEVIGEPELRAKFIETDRSFLSVFESAINQLRLGNIRAYNKDAKTGEFAQIDIDKHWREIGRLRELYNDYTSNDLVAYAQLANAIEREAAVAQPVA